VNHGCQPEQEDPLNHHGSERVVKSPNTPHNVSPK
jgi:hypothetical protein